MADDRQALDVEPVLAQLRAKRDQLDAAIQAIEALTGEVTAGSGIVPPSLGGRGIPADVHSIPSDAFFGMSVLDATEKFLNIAKKPQSANAIAAALEKGGLIHQSGNFVATVYTTLRRAEERGDRVIHVQKNWGLANWYPNRPRKTEEPPKKARKAKRPAGQRPKAVPTPKPEGSSTPPTVAVVSPSEERREDIAVAS